jgi:23S rRNA (cytosine1962-C5)-methyltransferase
LRFLIRPGDGLNTGLFLDMRETRAWVRSQSAGRTMLNCFAYTCAFGVAARAGGAARTANVDLSKGYLDWGRRNTALNGFEVVKTDFIFGDVFDWLRRFARAGKAFDLVILDPPSFATARRTRFSVERDYARLVALAAPVVGPGGCLLACANTRSVSERAFAAQVRQGLTELGPGRRARLARTTHEPAVDFPVAPGEAPYLKVAEVRFEV